MLGLFSLLESDYVHRDTQSSSTLKQHLSKAIGRVKKGLVMLHHKERDVSQRTQQAAEKFSVLLGSLIADYCLGYDASDESMASSSEEEKKKLEKSGMDLYREAAGLSPLEGETKPSAEEANTALLSYQDCEKFLAEKILNSDTAHIASLKQYLPSVWRKAVTSRKRTDAASGASNGGVKPESEEQKKIAANKVLAIEVEESEALQSKIAAPEFTLFVASNYHIVTHKCSMTAGKGVSGADAAPVGDLDCDDVVRVTEAPSQVTANNQEVTRLRVKRIRDNVEGRLTTKK